MTAILGYSELIASDPKADDCIQAHARKIKQQANRTKDLVINLLRFARQSDSAKTLVDINAVVTDSFHLRELESQECRVELRCHLGESLPPVWADQTQLLDVCFHLLGNALDAVRGQVDGVVIVSTRLDGDHVVIEVVDNGAGISDPTRVFDPFYTTKALGKGTGLGLSACYGIVKGHQGQITCENRDVGGARFVVRLPLGPTSIAATVGSLSRPTQSTTA